MSCFCWIIELLALERLAVSALVLGGIQFVSSHMNGVQSAVILLTVVELALVNGTLDGFIDLAHFCYLLLYVLYKR